MKHADLIARLEKLTGPDREVDAHIWAAVGRVEAPEGDPWDHTGPLDPNWIVNGRTMHRAIEMFPGDMRGIAASWEVPDFTGSLDAAVALVERMLPGLSMSIIRAAIDLMYECGGWTGDQVPQMLPRFILIALLRALQESDPAAKDEAQ